jgi:hypothetical protein
MKKYARAAVPLASNLGSRKKERLSEFVRRDDLALNSARQPSKMRASIGWQK